MKQENNSSKPTNCAESVGISTIPQTDLRPFHVYHAVNKLCMFTEKLEQPREYVGFILAKDLNDAWEKSQNDFNPHYAMYGKRSTSVGDMLMDETGFYLVKNSGFDLVCTLDDEEHKTNP